MIFLVIIQVLTVSNNEQWSTWTRVNVGLFRIESSSRERMGLT